MNKAMRWLVLVALCGAGCVAQRVDAAATTTRTAVSGAKTFSQFRMDQVRKFNNFVTSLRKKKLSPQEMQKEVKDYAKTKLIKAFLDFKATKEGAKAAEDIDRELILIGIVVAGDDSLVDRIVRSQKDEKKALELKLYAAEQYGRKRDEKKAKGLIDDVLKESKTKFPKIYSQAEAAVFRVAPVGMVFPEFPEGTKDLDGKGIKVSDYKGKIVLVDFWATWCGPCLSEIPNVVKAYQKYHGKGFEIVGISFDKSKEELLKLTKKEKMTWRQYFDGLGWGNKVGRAYDIRSIPAMYLLGKDGKVISNSVRGGRLEEILAKELGGRNK